MVVAVTLGAVLSTACGSQTPTAVDARTIGWTLAIESYDAEPAVYFGARIWLDGEVVYAEPALKRGHTVAVTRAYGSGAHTAEFEILAASAERSLYTMRFSAEARPSRQVRNADSVPTALRVGERLVYRVGF
jgi:hypothetical protein